MPRIASYLLDHWPDLGISAPRPSGLQWMVVNGGISIRSKLVCPVWLGSSLHPALIVKFARYPQYNAPLEVEYKALTELRSYLPNRALGAPRPLTRFDMDGLLVTVETAMPGRTLRAVLREHPKDYLPQLQRLRPFGVWLAQMHTKASRRFEHADFEQYVQAPVSAAVEELGLSTGERDVLHRLRDLGLDLSAKTGLQMVYNHNDPGTTNLMVDRKGDFVGVIDWEAGSAGLPVVDLFYFLARFAFETRGWGTDDQLRGFKELFFKNPVPAPATGPRNTSSLNPDLAQQWLAAYCRTLRLDPRWLPVLFGLTWVFHARNERKRLLGLRDEGQIIHGKPATTAAATADPSDLEHGHFRSQLRYYLENIDSSVVMSISGAAL